MEGPRTFCAVEFDASAFITGLSLPLVRASAYTVVTESVVVAVHRAAGRITRLSRPSGVALTEAVPAGSVAVTS